tara:strand:+ start:3170 stop:5710 length:2541 start_codon:yes stop_codon:yes gene_type:complete
MKKKYSLFILFFTFIFSYSQIKKYKSLDKSDPIAFNDNYLIYQNDTIILGPKAFFIDGQLSDKEVSGNPFVFNSVNEAVKHIINGTEKEPMVLYIAPYVYWIDNPDDPAIREPKELNETIPYGLEIKCEWLKFQGLTTRPENVVLACNRGQTIGAKGNFTMFHFDGDGTSSENLTFGNYCNIDLVFPLKPSLNREKRATAIVQAQLIICNGDKIVARNTHFISRLNLCPFVGGKRVFFDQCHFESTDDALAGTAVYKNCTFDFYSSKPFYRTTGTGAVFLNSDIQVFTQGTQYFTKANGQLSVIDTRFNGGAISSLEWRDDPPLTTKNYQYQVLVNENSEQISKNKPSTTVDLTNKNLLNAYRFEYKGDVIYNTYNLLSGADDWDPEGLKSLVIEAEKTLGEPLTKIPIQLKITPNTSILETGKDSLLANASLFRFSNIEADKEAISWNLSKEDQKYVRLQVTNNGEKCTIIPINFSNFSKQIVLTAKTVSGLEGTCVLEILPSKLEPPLFKKQVLIKKIDTGLLRVNYTYKDFNFDDQSLITWYRCQDKKGLNPMKVAVSRLNEPLKDYVLTAADVGYFIMVGVAPKHQRSDAGKETRFVLPSAIKAKDIHTNPNVLSTNFKNISLENQSKIIPGFWSFTHFDTSEFTPEMTAKNAWIYGKQDVRDEIGLLQNGRTASMSFTPVQTSFEKMKLTLLISPFKTAGQGFSVAHLYMDVVLNFDPKTKTGYGLRFIRTTKFGNAVDCYFVKYENNIATAITKPVTTSSFRSPCQIILEMVGTKLHAQVKSLSDYNKEQYPEEVVNEINIGTTVNPLLYSSVGIEYNGGSTTMIKKFTIEAKGINLPIK